GRSVTFAISDVHAPVEDDPSVIGSGPTVVTDPSIGPVDAQFVLAGSRRDAIDGACAEAAQLGYEVKRIDEPTLGDARDAARQFVVAARSAAPGVLSASSFRRNVAVIASGETTVTLAADSTGAGGRNQEFALAATLALAGVRPGWALASIGTDG